MKQQHRPTARVMTKDEIRADMELANSIQLAKEIADREKEEARVSKYVPMADARIKELGLKISPSGRLAIIELCVGGWDGVSQLRENLVRRYRGCGKLFISKMKAAGLIKEPTKIERLSGRALNYLYRNGIKAEPGAIKSAAQRGEFSAATISVKREIAALTGVEIQISTSKKWRFDPYTGQPLPLIKPKTEEDKKEEKLA